MFMFMSERWKSGKWEIATSEKEQDFIGGRKESLVWGLKVVLY